MTVVSHAGGPAADDPGVVPVPLPDPVPQQEGLLDVGHGHKLWYFDVGGHGAPLIALHSAVGSGAVWGYQQPVFAGAGVRLIGYSRRGYPRSVVGDQEQGGIASEDLLRLADHLRLGKFHLLGTAAGGMVATDFTVSHEDRLHSLVLANTIVGVRNDDYQAVHQRLWPQGFEEMPSDFKELGPSYRHLDVEGRRRWNALNDKSKVTRLGSDRFSNDGFANRVSWDHLAAWRLPVLLLTGDADLYSPPSVMRLFHGRIGNSERYLVPDCGHSAFWERPQIFNRVVLDFVKRHTRG